MNNEQIVREFIDVIWNQKQIDKVENYLGPEYKIYVDSGDMWEGKTLNFEEFKARLKQGSFTPFPDMHFEITSALADENAVAIEWLLTGTNSGPLGNITPTNKSINTRGYTIYFIKNGKITGHAQVFDRSSVAKQLGFMN